MGQEIELKLQIAATDVERLAEWAAAQGEAAIHPLRSIYFDTPGQALTRAGMSLRVRHDGSKWVQTIKSGQGKGVGLFVRDEWEKPVAGPVPEIGEDTPLFGLPPQTLDALAPIFEILVERGTQDIVRDGSTLELAIDRGEAVAADRRSGFCEIELELKGGAAEALFALAREIDAIVPVRLGTTTKLERGLHLLDAVAESVKSEPIPLSPDQTVQEAFAAIMGSCLRQYRLNEDILLARPGPEAIHQARVALRRVRSALSIFKDLTEDGQSDRLRGELKWLAGELGKARDLDVLLQATQDNDLRAKLIAERTAQYEALDQTLNGARPRALMLDFAQWLATGDWRENADSKAMRQAGVAGFAETALSKIFKRFRKQSAKLEKLSDEQRHEARKLAKKLRYGAEFFGELYTSGKVGKRHERFLDRLEKVQDGLGKLNDLANVPELLDRHGLAGARTEIDENHRRALIERAASACDALIETKPFWT